MKYYKSIESGYIFAVGMNCGCIEIDVGEYSQLMSIIGNKPQAPEGFSYRLKADTLKWELAEAPPVPVDPDIDDAEALDILLGGDGT